MTAVRKVLAPDTSVLSEEEFRAARRGKIGSSDIGAICGLNKWRSPLDVWLEMTGKVPPQPENRHMRLGKRQEIDVANEYAIETGAAVTKVGEIWQDPFSPWAIATPDFFATYPDGARRLLEAKTCRAMNFKSYEAAIPHPAHLQLMWQLGIGGEELGAVACLSGDREYIHHHVSFSPDVFSEAKRIAARFMERHVQADIPPEAGAYDLRTLQKLYPSVEPAKRVSLADIKDAIARYHEVSAELRRVELEKERLKAVIRQKMGDAELGIIGERVVVTLSRSERKEYLVKGTVVETMKVRQ